MTKSTKLLATLITGALCIITPAYACEGVDNQLTVFHGAMPKDVEAVPEDVFIGDVTIRLKTSWFFFKRDMRDGFDGYVHESPTHPHLEGKKINVAAIRGTSCGPYMDDEDRGILTGDILAEDDQNISLFWSASRDNDRLFIVPRSQSVMTNFFQPEQVEPKEGTSDE